MFKNIVEPGNSFTQLNSFQSHSLITYKLCSKGGGSVPVRNVLMNDPEQDLTVVGSTFLIYLSFPIRLIRTLQYCRIASEGEVRLSRLCITLIAVSRVKPSFVTTRRKVLHSTASILQLRTTTTTWVFTWRSLFSVCIFSIPNATHSARSSYYLSVFKRKQLQCLSNDFCQGHNS